ncbi:hypothetical protein [Robertkochia solimangrovi]|uniref:hypothetical protein n=1 Tax=Robertkochia solimangrovi TaxID=2213046 RepID=UPI00117E963D|nr:hypothetical protein [Robertkochia solimangrovi]TRZ42292.1 hypothetical protein DMZ48_14790 [Robertkochia solimangrovi]
MKTIKYIFSILLLAGLILASCEKEDYELGRMLDASEIEYEVVQDLQADAGGNTVILRNLTPKTTSIWDYGTGRSNRMIDTIRFAFKGEYTIKFSALTAGGVVELDPVTVSVTDDNLNYVNDPLWDALSGGVGNSKTWYLDLNAEGISKYFVGPQYFYGTDNGWLEGGDNGCYGDDCWNWNPDWAGNSWLMPAADYGSITFSLQGGPFVTSEHLTIPGRGTENGTYFLDADAKTLTMTDATILHPVGIESCVDNWANMRIFSLTEESLQLGVLRKGSCDGAAYLVYNFISKEYSDTWVPEETIPEPDEGFDPTFAEGELLEMLTGGVGSGRIWKLDGDGNAVDWLAGGIGWTSSSDDSRDWGWNDEWAAIASNSWVRFDQFGGTLNYTRNQNGVETTGTFSIDEASNEITLNGEMLIQGPDGHWMNPTTNVITVVKAFPGEFGTKGIWFGTNYDESKDEWFVWHYVIP